MKAGIFSTPSRKPVAAVVEGLEALGYDCEWQRVGVWTEDQARPYDLVVTMGLRLQSGDVTRHYRAQGVPVLVVDLPPLRNPGLWALWPGAVNEIPDEAPGDRLGLVELRRRSRGDAILVCGQKGGDAAHGMDRAALRDYFERTVYMLKAKHPDRRIVWRPHPQEPIRMATETSEPEAEPLSAAFDGVGAVVTYNSTCGLVAAAEGLPVFCDPSAYYRELSSPGLPSMTGQDRVPDDEEREAFFSRVSHVCWTSDEFATGEPQRETLARMGAA